MSKDNFIFNTTSGIRFGSGMSKLCTEEVSKKLGPNILFITDKDLMSLKLTEPTLNELRKFSSLVEIFQDVEADPSIKTLLNAIEVGKKIKKGDTLMIVEAMKTMNHVPSTSDGVVKEICVEDGQAVEFGQTIVILE